MGRDMPRCPENRKGVCMISKKLLTGLLAAACSVGMLAAITASAQYVGPTRVTAKTSIRSVLKNPVDDELVILKGRLTKQLSHDKYEFTDKTGTITVEIDQDVFAGRQIGPDTVIEIAGKVDKDTGKPVEIDVKRIGIAAATSKK